MTTSLSAEKHIKALLGLVNAWTATQTYNNDVLLAWGTGNDIVALDRSTALGADTALTSVLIGTPVSEAIAADSFMLSNTTASGDIAAYINRGGNSEQFMFMDASAGALYLLANTGGVMMGFAADPPAPDTTGLHIWRGTAGTIAAGASAALVLEDDGEVRLQFLATSASSMMIAFADPTGGGQLLRGMIQYINSGGTPADTMVFRTANAENIQLTTSTFAFQQAESITTTTGDLTINAAGNLVISDLTQHAAGTLIRFGATSFSTAGTNNIVLIEGTAPSGTLTDGGAIYVRDAAGTTELTYIDSAGGVSNVT